MSIPFLFLDVLAIARYNILLCDASCVFPVLLPWSPENHYALHCRSICISYDLRSRYVCVSLCLPFCSLIASCQFLHVCLPPVAFCGPPWPPVASRSSRCFLLPLIAPRWLLLPPVASRYPHCLPLPPVAPHCFPLPPFACRILINYTLFVFCLPWSSWFLPLTCWQIISPLCLCVQVEA